MPKKADGNMLTDRPAIRDWPGLMTKAVVADYIGYSTRWVEMKVSAGQFPQPVHPANSDPRWRRADVDRWIQGLAA